MIVVTAATGKLGSHVIEGLLSKVHASEVAVAVRNPDKARKLAARGVEVRRLDYADPATHGSAFRAGERVLLISSSEVGQRAKQHTAVVAAAKDARVGLLAYTSILRCDGSGLALSSEHKLTEFAISASGIPFVFLRNGWYFENYTEDLRSTLQSGVILGSSRDGRIAAASRADYAAAAVAVLTGGEHVDARYELAGDRSFTKTELAAEVSRQTGKTITYKDLRVDEYKATLIGFGLPARYAEALADTDVGIARGELDDRSGTLRTLIGRPTTTLATAVAAGLQG
jgi:NAD(P)H dehydrogenase (quinone)